MGSPHSLYLFTLFLTMALNNGCCWMNRVGIRVTFSLGQRYKQECCIIDFIWQNSRTPDVRAATNRHWHLLCSPDSSALFSQLGVFAYLSTFRKQRQSIHVHELLGWAMIISQNLFNWTAILGPVCKHIDLLTESLTLLQSVAISPFQLVMIRPYSNWPTQQTTNNQIRYFPGW